MIKGRNKPTREISLVVGDLQGASVSTAAFLAQALKFWLQGYFFMPKKTRMGHHLKNYLRGPKMVCFGQNLGLVAQNSQNDSGIRTKFHRYKVWSIFGLQLKFHQNRITRTGDIADSKSFHFLGGRFFTEGPITSNFFTSLKFYSMGLKPSLRVRCVQNLEKFGPTVQEIWPNEDFKFLKNDPRRGIFMKF